MDVCTCTNVKSIRLPTGIVVEVTAIYMYILWFPSWHQLVHLAHYFHVVSVIVCSILHVFCACIVTEDLWERQ